MKNVIIILSASVLIASVIYTGCNSPATKVENAEENVAKANEELNDANAEYLNEMVAYRIEANNKIIANERSIAEFKTRIVTEKKEARADYQKRVAELEQRNTDIKMKIDNYKANGKEEWEKFKEEFNRDMDELGEAFKGLTVNNVK